MLTLFENKPVYPSGFSYESDFLSPEEEETLLTYVRSLVLDTFTFQGYEAKRKVLSFGYDYHFDSRSITRGIEIPEAFTPLIKKVAAYVQIPASDFAELLVTEYPVGSVINWHRDAPPFETIAGISLQSDCVFKLRPHDKRLQHRSSVLSIPVKRRSLYIIRGEARNAWQHSTAPVKAVRYSITLRTLIKQKFLS